MVLSVGIKTAGCCFEGSTFYWVPGIIEDWGRLVVWSRNGRNQKCLCKKSNYHDDCEASYFSEYKERGKQWAWWEPILGVGRLLGAPMKTFPCFTSGDPAGWEQLLMAAEQNACVIVASTPGIERGQFLTPER